MSDSKMNPNIIRLAAEMLKEYSDRLANDSCNDMWLPDTKDNRQFLRDLAKWTDPKYHEQSDIIRPSKYGLGVYWGATKVASYLAYLLQQEIK